MEVANKLLIFSAPSGSGKTTIVHRLLKSGLPIEFSVSATSRPKRENETDGKDYYFITADEFREKISRNEFVEWEEVYSGCFYGTLKSELERIWNLKKAAAFDVDVKGGINLKKIFGSNALSIFIMPPSVQELEKRLRCRGTETEETLKKRIGKAEYELSFAKDFDVVVINDDLEKAVNETYDYVKSFLKI